MVERCLCKADVSGSNPLISTNRSQKQPVDTYLFCFNVKGPKFNFWTLKVHPEGGFLKGPKIKFWTFLCLLMKKKKRKKSRANFFFKKNTPLFFFKKNRGVEAVASNLIDQFETQI